MRMKKILCSLVAGAAILSLAACGNSGGSNKSADSGNSSGKTEITWWAFPVFTQKRPAMVLVRMKKKLSKHLKSQSRY